MVMCVLIEARGQCQISSSTQSIPYFFSFHNRVSLNQELTDWLDWLGSESVDRLVSVLSTSVYYRYMPP